MLSSMNKEVAIWTYVATVGFSGSSGEVGSILVETFTLLVRFTCISGAFTGLLQFIQFDLLALLMVTKYLSFVC